MSRSFLPNNNFSFSFKRMDELNIEYGNQNQLEEGCLNEAFNRALNHLKESYEKEIKELIKNRKIFEGDVVGIYGYIQGGKVISARKSSIVVDIGKRIIYNIEDSQLNVSIIN